MNTNELNHVTQKITSYHGTSQKTNVSSYSSMDQVKELKVKSENMRREDGKKNLLKGCYVGFSGLPPHLSGLSPGIELCWLSMAWVSKFQSSSCTTLPFRIIMTYTVKHWLSLTHQDNS